MQGHTLPHRVQVDVWCVWKENEKKGKSFCFSACHLCRRLLFWPIFFVDNVHMPIGTFSAFEISKLYRFFKGSETRIKSGIKMLFIVAENLFFRNNNVDLLKQNWSFLAFANAGKINFSRATSSCGHKQASSSLVPNKVKLSIDPRPSTNQSTSLKSGSLFLVMVSVRTYVSTYVQNKAKTDQRLNHFLS